MKAGDLAAARRLANAWLAARPADPDCLTFAALVAYQEGNFEAACRHFEGATQQGAASPGIQANYGEALRAAGRVDEAATMLRSALDEAPGQRGLLITLGAVELARGNPDNAIAALEAAGRTAALPPPALANLAMAHSDKGLHAAALEGFRQALAGGGAPTPVWNAFLSAVRKAGPAHLTGPVAALVANRLDSPGVSNESLALILIHAIKRSRGFHLLPDPSVFATDPLVLALLPASLIPDPDVETALTGLRRAALFEDLAVRFPSFAEALAAQCFLNGYVFAVTPEETQAIEKLPNDRTGATLFAMYHPLAARTTWRDAPPALVRQQIEEPSREHTLAAALPRLTTVVSDTSQAVQAQYEEHPYPRWTGVPQGRPRTLAERLTTDTGGSSADVPAPPIEVLVAGCGTGRHAIQVALGLQDAAVTAIDLSLASLGYAARQTAASSVKNLQFAQADITELARHPQRYHLIESVGVLHHTKEPEKSWAVLKGLLQPGGLMKIGLYSRLARREVAAARALLVRLGVKGSPEGLREARQAILAQNPGTPGRGIAEAVDFYSLPGCHDMLFNVQEHDYDLNQIADMLDRLGLSFLGFAGLPEEARRCYDGLAGEGSPRRDLDIWHQVELLMPDLFIEMYVFWCRPV